MVRAESSPREELKESIVLGNEFSIGLIKYVSKVIYSQSYCFKCDFLKVKEMVHILVRNRVCSCCLEADKYLTTPRHSHVLKKVGELKNEEDNEREDPESNENDV